MSESPNTSSSASSSQEDLPINNKRKIQQDDEHQDEDSKRVKTTSIEKEKDEEHVCSDECFSLIPKINFEAMQDEEAFRTGSIIENAQPCETLCDEPCPELNRELALKIMKQFVNEKDDFETVISEGDDEESLGNIIEFKKCGKKCFYKKVEDEIEILILLINENEYLYLGQAQAHAFYGMPGLSYLSSDGSALDISSKPIDVNDLISLSELLEKASTFLETVLDDGFH